MKLMKSRNLNVLLKKKLNSFKNRTFKFSTNALNLNNQSSLSEATVFIFNKEKGNS